MHDKWTICDLCGGRIYKQSNVCMNCVEEVLIDTQSEMYRTTDYKELVDRTLRKLDGMIEEAKRTGEPISMTSGILEGDFPMTYTLTVAPDGSHDARFEPYFDETE